MHFLCKVLLCLTYACFKLRAFLFCVAANKITKKGQTAFTCHARSTLEAVRAEIINETCCCDLSKCTGNKSLLIGHSLGWRQCGGVWFSSTCEDRGGVKLQVSLKTLANLPHTLALLCNVSRIYQCEGQFNE